MKIMPILLPLQQGPRLAQLPDLTLRLTKRQPRTRNPLVRRVQTPKIRATTSNNLLNHFSI